MMNARRFFALFLIVLQAYFASSYVRIIQLPRINRRLYLGATGKSNAVPPSADSGKRVRKPTVPSTAAKIGEGVHDDGDVDDDEEGDNHVAKEVKLGDEERLQKVIARAGITSRRGAEALIADGRVVVNGKAVIEAGTKVNAKKDMIMVDGKKLVLPDAKSTVWVMVNKPRAVLTTMVDDKKDKDRRTLLDLVPKARELRLVPVGTMERDSTGLMLLTNEVGWIHALTHHSFLQARRYEVVVSSFPEESDLDVLRKGGVATPEEEKLGISPLRPCAANIIDVDRTAGLVLLELVTEETRPQQLQHMMEIIKCPLVSTKRTGFGPLKMAGLRRGQWRELTPAEVERLKKSCRKISGVNVDTTTLGSVLRKSGSARAGARNKKQKRPGAGYLARTEGLRAQGTKVDGPSREKRGRKEGKRPV